MVKVVSADLLTFDGEGSAMVDWSRLGLPLNPANWPAELAVDPAMTEGTGEPLVRGEEERDDTGPRNTGAITGVHYVQAGEGGLDVLVYVD